METIGVVTDQHHASNPHARNRQRTVAIAMLGQGPMVLVGAAATAPPTLPDLIAAMKKEPTNWSYATSGVGTGQHLAGELFNTLAGTKMLHIPYKGGGQAVIDVVGGRVPPAFLGATPVLPHIKSGKLKAYAVTTSYRIDSLPEVPTMAEAGIKGFDAAQWYIVAAPKGVPPEVIEKLNGLMVEITASDEMKPALLASGSVASKLSAREVQAFVAADVQRWKELATKSKLDLR